MEKSATPCAWLNLRQQESDAVNLFLLLLYAIQHVLDGLDISNLLTLPSSVGGPRDELMLFRHWIGSLFVSVQGPLRVVFDGLDRLPPDASSHLFLRSLAEWAPANVQLLMLSRETPPYPIQDFKMNGETYIINNRELAFTLNETKVFLRNTRKLPVASEMIKQIHQLTEGWIGGLVLLCESLDLASEEYRSEIIAREFPARLKQETFEYLGEKIFASKPVPIQGFLVKSSFLSIIEPNFVRELLGYPDALQILDDLDRRNIFIHSAYDESRGRIFRYHQLFRGFLRAKFKATLTREEQLALYLRAGLLFEQRGEEEEAVRCYLDAAAYPQAIALIETVGLELLKMGRQGDLAQWLQALPEKPLAERPWLLFYQAAIRRFAAPHQNIADLQKAYALFEKNQVVQGQLLSLAYLIDACTAFTGHHVVPVSLLVGKAEELLQSASTGRYLWECSYLWLQLGFALRYGNLRKGCLASQNAYLIARNLGDIPLQLHALIANFAALTYLGEFPAAEKTCDMIERLLAKQDYPELRVLHLLFYTQLCICTDKLDRARESLDSARRAIEEHGLMYHHSRVTLYEILLRRLIGEYAEAEQHGRQALDMAEQTGNSYVMGIALMELGTTAYYKGDLRQAVALLERAIVVFSSDEGELQVHANISKITKNLALCHLPDHEASDEELQEAINFFDSISGYYFLAQAHLAMALLKVRASRVHEAAEHLQVGFSLARQWGYSLFTSICWEDLVRACALALELQVAGAGDYAGHLLSTRLAPLASPEFERLNHHPDPAVRDKALELRRAGHRATLPRLRIETLGGFRVLRDTSPVAEKEWRSLQPKLLLKALIARGARNVPKEVLAEDLWPGSDPELAEKNFKVILYRLRKALEPSLDKALGSSYVHLRANLLSLENDLCLLDTDEFSSLCARARQHEEEGDLKAACSLYGKAAEQYQGDFLPVYLYVPCIDHKRRELRQEYLEVLWRRAELNERLGRTRRAVECCRKVSQADPCFEQAYQKLMTIHLRLGKRSEAVRTYEECRKALREGLDTTPDELTASLYRSALAR